MSDGAPTSAPGGAAPAPAAQPTAGQPKPTTPPKPKAPEPAAPTWGEKDDADLVERLKRSPYGKLKANGKEEVIDSPDSLRRVLLDATRGRGANQLVEKTKAEKAEAEKMAGEAKHLREMLDRARRGDRAAARELGLIPDEERQREQQEWESLPPEVRALAQQNQELAERLRSIETEKQREMTERQESEKKAKRESTLKRAKEMATEVLKDVRDEMRDVELPEIITAMEAFSEVGQRLGVDYTAEHLKAYIEQQRDAGVWERVGRTKPDVAIKRLAPVLRGLDAKGLQDALGDDFVPIAKAFSAAWLGYHKRKSAPPPTSQAQKPAEKPSEPAAPLSRFRFGGR